MTNKPERDAYHHGDLREALIRAADTILAERGVEGFSLREAARRAHVSPAAPAHHFGSSAGLLTEVAILGFQELARHIDIERTAGNPTARLKRQGVGYVRFALAFPGRFHLMFRHELLLSDDARLAAASEQAKTPIAQTIAALRGLPEDAELDTGARAMLLAAWSAVHGFAHLALDGKFSGLTPEAGSAHLLEELLPEMLETLWPEPGS
ncbi:TetR/AcrR family transcriptional regulator [Mesorhizobium sp. B1-1-8]|uniref:TetR/AcrR family transcriptional regulator n=1 Tax=Mesorhizobium sp. B1-1-8 TaxID=2589976 RepID=UPI001129306E|nr:TetR/AcrR family transcriptional regulator [Mesorhizobium sp. B1-1-8]UCI06176.1 TetR/AcrR family transcriptional regulator [Mesorhizobium sp. B1-1-8]